VREIWYEHFHRYALAAHWCDGMRVLDAACGEGYGSAVLAKTATTVEAVDIAADVVEHASKRYEQIENLNYHVADCISLPFADNDFDRVVSFETLEHLAEQDALLAEFRRVLKPEGVLILSSPDKAVYSDLPGTSNHFHVKELYRDELEALVSRHFDAWSLLGQKLAFHSMIWSLDGVKNISLDQLSDENLLSPQGVAQSPMYLIALCAAEKSLLPDSDQQLWLFDDQEESVYQHYQGEIQRNMAAGGIIAELEKEIEALKVQVGKVQAGKVQAGELSSQETSWWQRLFGRR